MDNKITESQAKKIYETLDKKDTNSNKEKLQEAINETNNSNYTEINEMNTTQNVCGVSGSPAYDIDYSKALDIVENSNPFEAYGIAEEDIPNLLEIINKHKNTTDYTGIYNELPESLKTLCDNMNTESRMILGERISKDNTAKVLIESLMSDLEFEMAMAEYNNGINELMESSNKELQGIINGTFEELFDKIDEVEKEDPDKANLIRSIKKGFEDAETYARLLDLLDNISAKKINKLLNKYDSECVYFNKKVNTTNVKVPDIRYLYSIIKKALPGFTEMQIKKFIVIICRSAYSLDTNNIAEISYFYRLINNILSFKYTNDMESDFAKKIFGNITVVIQKIINL